jgi:hypothetical protein
MSPTPLRNLFTRLTLQRGRRIVLLGEPAELEAFSLGEAPYPLIDYYRARNAVGPQHQILLQIDTTERWRHESSAARC